jgi:hypothetical protein
MLILFDPAAIELSTTSASAVSKKYPISLMLEARFVLG